MERFFDGFSGGEDPALLAKFEADATLWKSRLGCFDEQLSFSSADDLWRDAQRASAEWAVKVRTVIAKRPVPVLSAYLSELLEFITDWLMPRQVVLAARLLEEDTFQASEDYETNLGVASAKLSQALDVLADMSDPLFDPAAHRSPPAARRRNESPAERAVSELRGEWDVVVLEARAGTLDPQAHERLRTIVDRVGSAAIASAEPLNDRDLAEAVFDFCCRALLQVDQLVRLSAEADSTGDVLDERIDQCDGMFQTYAGLLSDLVQGVRLKVADASPTSTQDLPAVVRKFEVLSESLPSLLDAGSHDDVAAVGDRMVALAGALAAAADEIAEAVPATLQEALFVKIQRLMVLTERRVTFARQLAAGGAHGHAMSQLSAEEADLVALASSTAAVVAKGRAALHVVDNWAEAFDDWRRATVNLFALRDAVTASADASLEGVSRAAERVAETRERWYPEVQRREAARQSREQRDRAVRLGARDARLREYEQLATQLRRDRHALDRAVKADEENAPPSRRLMRNSSSAGSEGRTRSRTSSTSSAGSWFGLLVGSTEGSSASVSVPRLSDSNGSDSSASAARGNRSRHGSVSSLTARVVSWWTSSPGQPEVPDDPILPVSATPAAAVRQARARGLSASTAEASLSPGTPRLWISSSDSAAASAGRQQSGRQHDGGRRDSLDVPSKPMARSASDRPSSHLAPLPSASLRVRRLSTPDSQAHLLPPRISPISSSEGQEGGDRAVFGASPIDRKSSYCAQQ